MAILIMDFSHKYSLSFFNPIEIVTVKGKSVQPCEHGLVENLLCVCVCVALLNSSIKAVFQVRIPESLGVAKNHTERYCENSASWFQAPGPPRQLWSSKTENF